jgi:sugar lactone lactonase YvrE
VYVLDAQSSALLRYSDEGSFLDVLRTFEPGRGELPQSLAVDTTGRVLLCQASLHQVSLLDQSHRVEAVVGGFGARPGDLSRPLGVAFASDGTFYVADTGNRRIERFTAVGNFVAVFADSSPIARPQVTGGESHRDHAAGRFISSPRLLGQTRLRAGGRRRIDTLILCPPPPAARSRAGG